MLVFSLASLLRERLFRERTSLEGDSIERFQLEFWLEKSLEFWLGIPHTKQNFKGW